MRYTQRFFGNAKRVNSDVVLFVSCVGSIVTQDFYVSSAVVLSVTLVGLILISVKEDN